MSGGGELWCAQQAGFPMERVFVHGNNKTPQELRDALVFHSEQMRPNHPHKTATERLEEYYHTPVDQISPTKEDEIDWGKPQGNEIW